MDITISFDGLAEVANNVLNKLSDAVGWVANHDTPRRIATSTYIQEIQNSNYDPLVKAALISNAKKSIKEYCNQTNIVGVALQSIKPTAKPNDVDDDWLSQFMDKARLVSDSEFQILWGNILAEECNVPGSVPKSLLHIMEQMDKEMAMEFMSVAAVSVYTEEDGVCDFYPVIWGESMDEYKCKYGITFGSLIDLQSIGLIETRLGPFTVGFSVTVESKPTIVRYFEQKYKISDDIASFEIGRVVYTKAGEALCRAVKPRKTDGFFDEYCISRWEKEEAKKRSQT